MKRFRKMKNGVYDIEEVVANMMHNELYFKREIARLKAQGIMCGISVLILWAYVTVLWKEYQEENKTEE